MKLASAGRAVCKAFGRLRGGDRSRTNEQVQGIRVAGASEEWSYYGGGSSGVCKRLFDMWTVPNAASWRQNSQATLGCFVVFCRHPLRCPAHKHLQD